MAEHRTLENARNVTHSLAMQWTSRNENGRKNALGWSSTCAGKWGSPHHVGWNHPNEMSKMWMLCLPTYIPFSLRKVYFSHKTKSEIAYRIIKSEKKITTVALHAIRGLLTLSIETQNSPTVRLSLFFSNSNEWPSPNLIFGCGWNRTNRSVMHIISQTVPWVSHSCRTIYQESKEFGNG